MGMMAGQAAPMNNILIFVFCKVYFSYLLLSVMWGVCVTASRLVVRRMAGRVFCCSVTGEGSAETNGKICQSGLKGAALAAAQ